MTVTEKLTKYQIDTKSHENVEISGMNKLKGNVIKM